MHIQNIRNITTARIILCCLLTAITLTAKAQAKTGRDRVDSVLEAKHRVIDSMLIANYRKITYDTNYIRRPDSRLTVKVRTNVSGNTIHAKGMVRGVNAKSDMKTAHKATLSVGVNLLGITAGIAINPAKLAGRNHDFEINLNAFSNRYSLDVVYQDSKTLSGTLVRDGVSQQIERGCIGLRMLNVAGYYVFNYRRFSYPAAFTQSYIQTQSAGSWLVGFSYQGGRFKTTKEKPADIPSGRIYAGHFGVGGGYAYNLVLGKRWLLHFSALPTLVIINRNNFTIEDQRVEMETCFPDVILNERVAIVRNFSDKYFAGATFIMSNTLFGDDNVKINENKWRARAFFGFRI